MLVTPRVVFTSLDFQTNAYSARFWALFEIFARGGFARFGDDGPARHFKLPANFFLKINSELGLSQAKLAVRSNAIG